MVTIYRGLICVVVVLEKRMVIVRLAWPITAPNIPQELAMVTFDVGLEQAPQI